MSAGALTTTRGLDLLPDNLRQGLQARQLPALDAVRAVAVLLVVFYHFSNPMVPGGLGVLAFFVLSGFLITWLLLIENEKFNGISLRLFYLRRSLRIFPAFYSYWALCIAASLLFGVRIVWDQAWSSFFYINNYYQAVAGDPNTLLSHTWSLAVEEQFYLLWPAAFLSLRRNLNRMSVVLACTIAAVWVHRLLLLLYWGVPAHYMYEAFDTRADHLLTGCMLAVVLRTGAWQALWQVLCATPAWSVVTFGALVASVIAGNFVTWNYRDTIGFIVNPVLVALLIPQLIAFRNWAGWRWVNWGWVQYLGRISYSVYLYQQIVPSVVNVLFGTRTLGPAVRLPVELVVLLMMSSFSYWVIEKPFLKLKDKFGSRASVPKAPGLSVTTGL